MHTQSSYSQYRGKSARAPRRTVLLLVFYANRSVFKNFPGRFNTRGVTHKSASVSNAIQLRPDFYFREIRPGFNRAVSSVLPKLGLKLPIDTPRGRKVTKCFSQPSNTPSAGNPQTRSKKAYDVIVRFEILLKSFRLNTRTPR